MLEYDSVCPSCRHREYAPMGIMGTLAHYRCKQCGWGWIEQLPASAVVRATEGVTVTIEVTA